MSTEPTTGQHEENQPSDPKVAEASKLFDKLFSKIEPAKIVSGPASLPQAVSKEVEAGETFTRKVTTDSDDHSFQRVVSGADDETVKVPDRFVNDSKESAVPPSIQKTADTPSIKTHLEAQDIPTSVDAVESETVKAQLLAKAKAAKYAAKPVIDFPARVSNIKTQNDKLRARLESLERQE